MTNKENIKKVVLWLISQGIVDSQEQLAKKLGYNASFVSQIVSGIKPLSHKFANKICSLSEKINKDYLFAEAENILIDESITQSQSLGNNSSIVGGNVIGGNQRIKENTLDPKELYDMLDKKDKQIDKLISIIEKLQK